MDTQEAKRLIDEQLARYRTMGYTALLRLLDAQDRFELEGAGGTKYQVEISAIWDGQKGGACASWVVSIMGAGGRSCRFLQTS